MTVLTKPLSQQEKGKHGTANGKSMTDAFHLEEPERGEDQLDVEAAPCNAGESVVTATPRYFMINLIDATQRFDYILIAMPNTSRPL